MDLNTTMLNQNTCVLINSCSKYSYILHPFFTMLRRWWPDCYYPIYLACDGDITEYKEQYKINIIEQEEDYGFVEGRLDALEKLKKYQFVIMLQDDFIIERYVDSKTLAKLASIMKDSYKEEDATKHIACIRLMPCPGPEGKEHPNGLREIEGACWCKFSFQASIWNRKYYIRFFTDIIESVKKNLYQSHYRKLADEIINDKKYWLKLWIKNNIAEGRYGANFTLKYPEIFLGVIRDGPQSNAVYRSPIPYRPTAIVRGKLEDWAIELFKREGIKIKV